MVPSVDAREKPLDPFPSGLPRSPAGLSVWDSRSCLVTALVSELHALETHALRATVVVLPTQRLALWVTAALAARRPAFVPPVFHTLDGYIRTTYAQLASEPPLPLLSDLESELLLAGLIKKGKFRHLRVGHEHEVHQFFAELQDWGFTDTAFQDLERVAAENVYLSEHSLDTLRERILELQSLHDLFLAETQKQGAFTKAQILAFESRALSQLLDRAVETDTRTYLAGFTSFKAQYTPLLQALLRRARSHIWVSEPPDLASPLNPLRQIIQDLSAAAAARIYYRTQDPHGGLEETREASSLPAPKVSGSGPHHLAVVQTPTVLAEVAEALRLAQDAVDQGLPPSSIAILVSDDTCYGSPLRALVSRLKMPSNTAISTPLAETPLGTWLSTLCTLARSDELIPDVLAHVGHPLSFLLYRGQDGPSRAALYAETAASGVVQGLQILVGSPALKKTTQAFVARAVKPLAPFLTAEKGLKKSFATWLDPFQAILKPLLDFCSGSLAHSSAMHLDARDTQAGADFDLKNDAILRSAHAAIKSVLDSLLGVAPWVQGLFTKNDFLAIVAPKFLTQDCRDVGEPLRGIQILSIEEARYIPFEKIILLGAAEGQFPRALPKDHLLDNYLKMRIGLPGWQFLEAIEDTTYHLLRARVPSITLLYPTLRGTTPVVRSRFIEAALVLGETVLEAVTAEESLLALMMPPRPSPSSAEVAVAASGELGVLGHYQGDRASLLLSTSASALTALIRCPYRFLLEKLKVRPLEFKDADDPQQEGDWLHGVLEAFFTGQIHGKTVGAPLRTAGWAEDTQDFRRYALDRLATFTDALAPAGFQEAPVKLHLELFAWPQFVDHVIALYGTQEGLRGLAHVFSGAREAPIGRKTPVTLAVGSHTVSLKGSIDAVERLPGLHVITDYKRRGTPKRKEALNGLSPQLAFYALAYGEEHPTCAIENAVVGYWSILQGAWIPVARGEAAQEQARALGLISPQDKSSLEDATQNLLRVWQWRLDTLLSAAGLFEPDPSVCDHCPYDGVCRKNDPVWGEAIAKKAHLAAKLGLSGKGPPDHV